MSKSSAAGIVLYNPVIDRLRLNIEAVSTQVETVYLFDNGSFNKTEIESLITPYPNVTLISSNKNLGIATALNRILLEAESFGHQWLLTLDQDSVIAENTIPEFQKYITEDNTAIICPKVVDIRRKNEKPPVTTDNTTQVQFCITSGSYVNIAICRKIGGFDDWLFIGLVDNDFCKRVVLSGYRIVRVNSVVMDHELGNLKPSRFEKSYLRIGRFLHSELIQKLSYQREVSPMRLYYTARNLIYMSKKYSLYKKQSNEAIKIFLILLSNLLRGRRKALLFKAIIKGVKEGIHCKVPVYKAESPTLNHST